MIKKVIDKLWEETNGRKREDVINDLEEILSENILELLKNQYFFHLPLNYIFSVVSKVDFNSIDESEDDGFEVLQNIIKTVIKAHPEEKETFLLLQNIDVTNISLSCEKIISIFELFTNCPFLQYFCKKYKEKQILQAENYENIMQQRNKALGDIKQQINGIQINQNILPKFCIPFFGKPKDIDWDIFSACKEGKLANVKRLIEQENVDKNKKVEFYINDTPIHIASQNGHLPIVEYLIEQQNVEIDIKGYNERTPLLCAFRNGHLPIVEYLISKGADVNAKDEFNDYVIHYASEKDSLPIVKSLIEQYDVDIDMKGWRERTPLHCACNFNNANIVKYLISKGANQNAKDTNGKPPYELTTNEEIRSLFNCIDT